MTIKFFALALLAATLSSAGDLPPRVRVSTLERPDWKTLSVPEYSIKHPPSFAVNDSGLMGTSFVIFLSAKKDPIQFNPNVNLIIQDLRGMDLDLDKYTDLTMAQIQQMIPNPKILENARQNGAKGTYHKLVYSGDQAIYRLMFEQFYTIVDQKAYILTLSCEEKRLRDCKKVGEDILNTFVIR